MNSIQDRLEEELMRRNRNLFILISIASVLVTAGIFYLLVHGYLNKKYYGYKVLESVKRDDGNAAKYVEYNGKLLKYSKDGACVMDTSGKEYWNASYEMKNPTVDVSDNYVIVADVEGKTAYIYDSDGVGKELDTDYPIEQACISDKGIVSVMVEEESSDSVYIYDFSEQSKKLVAEVPTNVEDGYPVAMDISPNGTSIVVGYVYMTSGKPRSRVSFYNFTKIGQDKDCLVGAKNYKDSMVGDIKFLEEDKVCLFREDGYSIWENMKQPVQKYNRSFKKKIRSAVYNDSRIGLVFEKDKEGKQGELCLYDFSGKKILDRVISSEYDYIRLSSHDEILTWTSGKCRVYRENGLKKWDCSMDVQVENLLDVSGHAKYILITGNKVEKIQLKKK